MKKHTMLVLATVALGLLAPVTGAQMTNKMTGGMHGMHSHPAMAEGESPTMSCNGMAKMREGMKEKMNAMDAKLDGLVAEMNEATGSARVDKMAAVVNELVAQRSTMQEMMMSMQPMMMYHMTSHMESGTTEGMPKRMSDCPMMASMTGGKAHDEHH